MPWESVNQTGEAADSAVPTPFLALDVQRASMPGAPGALSWMGGAIPGECIVRLRQLLGLTVA